MGKMNLNKLTYEEIEERYIKFNIINYKFQNAE